MESLNIKYCGHEILGPPGSSLKDFLPVSFFSSMDPVLFQNPELSLKPRNGKWDLQIAGEEGIGSSGHKRSLVVKYSNAIEKYRIEYQEMHMERVQSYSVAIGKRLLLAEDDLKDLAIAAKMHDIGKAFIDAGVLNKPRKLSQEEMQEVKKHPEIAYWLLKSDSRYQKIAVSVRHHHERWDGLGYPGGLKSGEIPLFSRIIAVADAYDAMTSKRVYQKTRSCEEAVRELFKHSGSQFDPCIVKIFAEKVLLWSKT